jgi:hypothetical protein
VRQAADGEEARGAERPAAQDDAVPSLDYEEPNEGERSKHERSPVRGSGDEPQHARDMSEYEELDRYALGDPEDPRGDRATLRQLADHGADLSKRTSFIHYIVFHDRARATAAERLMAETLGYDVRGPAPEEPDGEWLVMAEREEVPTLANIDRMRAALSLAAEHHGGDYDGWEAAIRRKAMSLLVGAGAALPPAGESSSSARPGRSADASDPRPALIAAAWRPLRRRVGSPV